MATYTDLHNRVKENITVDYNSRITPQEVHFKNENNEYWGKLKGQVTAENIDIKGGKLSGVTLENIKVIGSLVIPSNTGDGNVDVSRIATDVAIVSNDIDKLTKNNTNDHEKFDGDITKILERIAVNETNITNIKTDISTLDDKKIDAYCAEQKLSTQLTSLTHVISDISSDLFDTISDVCDELSDEIDSLSTALSGEIDSLSTALSTEVSNNIAVLNNTDNLLSNELTSLEFKFGGEVQDRILADDKISAKILNVEQESINRDNQITKNLQNYKIDTENNFIQLSNNISKKIEHDKHYTLTFSTENGLLTDHYPYDCKDFAVNVYNTELKEGIVEYTDETDQKYIIGELIRTINGFNFKTYSNIESNAIISAINANGLYEFLDGNLMADSAKENSYYKLVLNKDNKTITLKPIIPNYNAIMFGNKQVGKIYDAYIVNDNIISGKMYINTNATELSTFNKFQNIEFNSTTLSTLLLETEQFEYFGNNELRFCKNVNTVNYIPLNNNTEPRDEFARIYDIYNSENLTSEINVTLTYLRSNEKTVSLNETNGYKYIIEADANKEIILSANIVEQSAAFDIVEVRELYKYGFNGINEAGETTEIGYIVPVQYNTTIIESKDFNSLSVNLANVVPVDAFKNTYILTKNDNIWDYETSVDGNSLNIKFNGDELRAKITSRDGGVTAYSYKVNINNPEIFNINECYRHLYTTDLVRLIYTATDKTSGDSYLTYINPEPMHDLMPTYVLRINNTEANIIKICIPERQTTDISREFTIVIKPTHFENKLVELQLTNKAGDKINYISNRRDKLLIPTNLYTNLQVNEINHNKFFIKDLDANENAHDVRTLSASIEKLSTDLSGEIDSLSTKLSADLSIEIENRIEAVSNLSTALSGEIDSLSTALSGEIDSLSTKLSTDLSNEISARLSSFEYLSSQISSNDNDIAEIFKRIKGGINYKGTVVCEIESTDSTGQQIKEINSISALFFREGTTPKSLYKNADEILSSGYMYIVTTLSPDANKKFNIEGRDIEVGDQIIINCKDADGKAIKDLTINDVDIIDNEDYDTVHQPEFIKLSNDLSGEIDSLSNALSNDISVLSINLSTEISSLSNNISNDVSCLSVKHLKETEYLSAEISSKIFIDDRINNDINGHSDLSIIKISKEEYDNLNVPNHSLLCANTLYVVEADYIDAYGQVISNLVMTDNTNPSEATNKDYVDAIDLRLDTKINTLSDNLSTEISTLSINLSTDLSNISASIEISASDIRRDITTISDDLLSINTRYVNTFVASKNEHISSDNLILTKTEHAENDADPQHKQYKMMFERGTIVLKPLN